MSEAPVLWIFFCGILSAGLVWLQYFFAASPVSFRWSLAVLRFLSVFGILVLLVDPKIRMRQTELQKHTLILLADNSRSIAQKGEGEQLRQLMQEFTASQELNERFQLQTYVFGKEPVPGKTLDFSEERTDIARALTVVSDAVLSRGTSVILLSDGNDNYGRDYSLPSPGLHPVYPVVVGDTTRFFDLRIDRINLNRYAFLGNTYPVEVLWSFTGEGQGQSQLTIRDRGRVVSRKELRWNAGTNSGREVILLEADKTGVHRLEVSLDPVSGERNIKNNSNTVGLEVLDERLDIRIVSSVTHPDLGVLKRSLLRNPQRQCRIESPGETLATLQDAGLLILYQPDQSFASLYDALENRNTPRLTITGPATDWRFLNQAQSSFSLANAGPVEDLLPEMNAAFSYFDPGDWEVGAYPPLEGVLGTYKIAGDSQAILEQKVRGLNLGQPLLALLREDRREGVLFGSGLWQWSLQEYRQNGDLRAFDEALGKIVLFLSSGRSDERLTLDYQPYYEGLQGASIQARLVDEAYNFDPGARLVLELQDSSGQSYPGSPMSLRSGFYEYDLGQLQPGSYRFTVRAEGTEREASGAFELQAFDMEARQISSDAGALGRLADQSGGRLFFPSEVDNLKDSLLQSNRFRPVQKSQVNVVSLVDYRWLLGCIAFLLAAEWFMRKYNGLI